MRFAFQSELARSGKYRADIDGLRAIAVLSVLFFHANIGGFTGGYVGVDVFFVISGYLITSIILKDEAGEGFTFTAFYERRARRIFPALFGVLAFCTLAALVLFAPKDLRIFGEAMTAATLFVSNIYFALVAKADGYFNTAADPQALLHTWSLAVEEQFYLLFPIFLVWLTRRAKSRTSLVLSIAALASFALNLWATHKHPVLAFYIFIPRAWELLIGALLAVKALPLLGSRLAREIAGWAGLAMIACAIVLFTRETPFPGANALLPCVGAWLIIYSGEHGPSTAKSVLSFKPLVFIGLISYSLYLWHWPILVFARYFAARELHTTEALIALAVSLLFAFFSFEFIERPFRGARSKVSRAQIFSLGAAASMVSIILGIGFYLSHGVPGRYDSRTRLLVLENTERRDDFQEVCTNYKKEVRRMADIAFCNLGPTNAKKIMFWGDSHVQQLYPLIEKFSKDGALGDHGAILAVANGCLPAEHLNSNGKGYHCDSFARFAMERAEADDIDTVFIAFNSFWATHEHAICPSVDGVCTGQISIDESRRRFNAELGDHISQLTGLGKRVIVSLPFPIYDRSIPDLQIRNAVFRRFGLSGNAADVSSSALRDDLLAVAKRAGAEIFDPRASLCNAEQCLTAIDGVSIYKDNNHIAASQIGILESNLAQAIEPHAINTDTVMRRISISPQ